MLSGAVLTSSGCVRALRTLSPRIESLLMSTPGSTAIASGACLAVAVRFSLSCATRVDPTSRRGVVPVFKDLSSPSSFGNYQAPNASHSFLQHLGIPVATKLANLPEDFLCEKFAHFPRFSLCQSRDAMERDASDRSLLLRR